MPGAGPTASPDDILYGTIGSRGILPRAKGELHLPKDLDPDALDASSRFEITRDDGKLWTGSGSHWMAQGPIFSEWEGSEWSTQAAFTGQANTEEYLHELEELEEDEHQTAYEMSQPVTFDHRPGADEVAVTTLTPENLTGEFLEHPVKEHYRLPAQRLAAVERVAGPGGEWRFFRFYVTSIGGEYMEMLYFHGQELYGSASIEHMDHPA